MKSRQDADCTIRIVGDVQFPAKSLVKFRLKHAEWLSHWEADGPVYCLPKKSIDGLQRSIVSRRPLLDKNESAIETAFTDLCEENKAVGCWMSKFVKSTYLTEKSPLPSAAKLRKSPCNWTTANILQAQQLVKRTDAITSRLLGYMGWLITDSEYIKCSNELAKRWVVLSATADPLPIQRACKATENLNGAKSATKKVAAFQHDLETFLDRWGLVRMVTWDIPEPQGPMLPAQLPANAPAMPQHGLHIVLPVHYPLTGTDELLRQIRQQQIELANQANLDPSMAGLPHFEVYARIFKVALLEKTIQSRYRKTGQKRGLVTVMERVIAETLEISVDRVQKLRKGISACRRGKRSKVKWLNLPA